MLYEFCAENLPLIEQALEAGAGRVELCDNLAVGGTTPSYGVMRGAVLLADQYDARVMTMIRPRGGDFVYSALETEIMLLDIDQAKAASSQGLVFGALTKEGELDKDVLKRLISAGQGLEMTVHMAFDCLAKDQQLEAIDWLSQHGVQRILTHGGPAEEPIEAHFDWLKELIAYADGRIEILVGGGVHLGNREQIAQELGIQQLHGTRIVF
ncbi:copper homeostasis protein CutC [Streptococcus oricebi]|uniref:PF03932 family protein CutC n=1 Tax=Streptococcus oricebi TaxID=1547447 RepID=A0ABS5B2E2_9STRE|nr:copper homeostasis protein CutC [Streptococcus oricebi]MBP2622992.1 copper homeostasis protein CutC [Streptococcus oricebi]